MRCEGHIFNTVYNNIIVPDSNANTVTTSTNTTFETAHHVVNNTHNTTKWNNRFDQSKKATIPKYKRKIDDG